MNNFVGKICPFCKTAFLPDDEIVVCSECEMPHHKDCWIENQGCTTFGCLGTISGVDDDEVSSALQVADDDNDISQIPQGYIYCSKCGAQNERTFKFCSNCGNNLAETTSSEQTLTFKPADDAQTNPYAYVEQQIVPLENNCPNNYNSGFDDGIVREDYVDKELKILVGTKLDYYIPRFNNMKAQDKKSSWNWAAFFVTPYWLMYRKMYGYGIAVLIAQLVILMIDSSFLYFAALCGYIAIGIYGNFLYMRFLENKIVQTQNTSEPFRTMYLAKNGGVNVAAVVFTAIGYLILLSILPAI